MSLAHSYSVPMSSRVKFVQIWVLVALQMDAATNNPTPKEQRTMFTLSLANSLCFGYTITIRSMTGSLDSKFIKLPNARANCSFVQMRQKGKKLSHSFSIVVTVASPLLCIVLRATFCVQVMHGCSKLSGWTAKRGIKTVKPSHLWL